MFFITVLNYPAVHSILTQQGFIPGEDFINGLEFLSDVHGVPLKTNFLIKVL